MEISLIFLVFKDWFYRAVYVSPFPVMYVSGLSLNYRYEPISTLIRKLQQYLTSQKCEIQGNSWQNKWFNVIMLPVYFTQLCSAIS